jgi:hypothetical protein
MQKEWTQQFAQLSQDYPLGSADPDDPSLALAIDEGVKDKLLSSRGDHGPTPNPLYVENLLQDCINRISNCLTLREKAQDVEERAVSAALLYNLQKKTIETQTGIAQAFDAINSKMAQNATLATLDQGKVNFEAPAQAWETTKLLRTALEGALTSKNETVKLKSSIKGNASNYVERFKFLKTLFDLNLVECYKRALVVEDALKKIYGITATLPDIVEFGYLNSLATWAQTTSDALDRELDNRHVGSIGLTLASNDETVNLIQQLLTRAAFTGMVPQQKFAFNLGSVPFDTAGMKDVLLRTVKVQIEGVDVLRTRAWPVVIKTPARDASGRAEQFSVVASTSLTDSADSEGSVKGVHNIDPRGDWELKLAPHALTGENTEVSQVKNIYLLLNVSYRRV